MQNGYSQKKYQHALYGIRISVVMPNSKIRRDQRKQKRYYNAPDEIKRIMKQCLIIFSVLLSVCSCADKNKANKNMRKFTSFLLICLALSTLASCSEGGNNITLENFELYKSDLDRLVNLFKSSIPSEIREEKKVFFCLGREDESISIAIDGYTNGKRNIRGGYSIKKGGKEYKEALAYLGWTETKVDSIQSLLKKVKCTTISTGIYKYFDVELCNFYDLDYKPYSYSYLHAKPNVSLDTTDIKPILISPCGDQFTIR